MPAYQEYGAQPPIELLRQLVAEGGFYDRPNFFWKTIEKFTVVAAAAPPGGGRQALTPRFMRFFHILNVQDPTEETLTEIFSGILTGFLNSQNFIEPIRKQLPVVTIASTIDLYT